MTTRILPLPGLFMFIASAPLIGAGQDSLQLVVHSSKPLKDICLQLEEKLHWRIAYEEAPVMATSELVDEVMSTGAVRRTRRLIEMIADVPAALPNNTEEGSQRETLDKIVSSYNGTTHGGVFKAIYAGGGLIYVVPVAVRDTSGDLQPFEPMLNTPVSLPKRSYSLGELVSEILAQVGNTRGIPIVEATVPINLFAQSRVTEEANAEPARNVLVRAFEEINGPRLAMHDSYLSLTWYLLYNAEGGRYFFNVHALPEEPQQHNPAASAKQGKSESPTDHSSYNKKQ